MHRGSTKPRARTRQAEAGGFSLVEVLIASTILIITSLSLAYAFSSTGLSSKSSDRSLIAQASLEGVGGAIDDVPFHELRSWHGTSVDRGDHTVKVSAQLIEIGLLLVELVVVDDHSGRILARLATYRSGEL